MTRAFTQVLPLPYAENITAIATEQQLKTDQQTQDCSHWYIKRPKTNSHTE